MYWRVQCSSQVARPCFLRKPDIVIGTVMATATEPFSINKTAIGTEIMTATGIEIATETEIGTGIAIVAGVTVMMIAMVETATALMAKAAITADEAATETPANTVIKMA
jgi:hypothetical protein